MKKCITSNLKTIVTATLFSIPFSVAPAFADEPQDESRLLDQSQDQSQLGRQFQGQFQSGRQFQGQTQFGGRIRDAAQFWASQDLETKVLSRINAANLHEIRAARLGVRRALRDDVREFAAVLEKDHSEARKKLLALALLVNRPLLRPIAETVQERREMRDELLLLRRLARMAQRDFDTHYLSAMESAHAKLIEKLQAVLSNLEGTKTSEHIKEILPVLQKHLETARRLQARADY